MAFAGTLLLFGATAVLLLLSLRALATTGVPVRSASAEAVAAALDLLALREGESFCDLGCGRGNVLGASRKRGRIRAIGYELNPVIAGLAALRHLLNRDVRVRCADSRRADLSHIDAVYAYLMPRAMAELSTPLEKTLRAGTRVASVDFPIPGWTPAAVREVGPLRQPVYLYVLGEHR
jgi:hypothetical protein